MIPSPWVGLVLALAVFRVARLVGWDDFPPIVKLRARATGEVMYFNPTESKDQAIYRYDRPLLAKFLGCSWCAGFWLSLAAYLAWVFEPRWTLYGLAPLALAAAVGLIATRLDP